MITSSPWTQATTFDTRHDELARRLLLDRAEQERVGRDRGRPERIRYGSMQCRILEIANADRLRVRVDHESWVAAGRPSRGTWRIAADNPVAIADAFPAMCRDHDGAWVFDVAKPVDLVIGWKDLLRVDLVDADRWPCQLLPPGNVIATDRGGPHQGRPTALPPGPVRLRFAGEQLTASILPYRTPRPKTPTLDLDEVERWRLLAAAEAGEVGYDRIVSRRREQRRLDELEAQERRDLADWTRDQSAPQTSYALDRNLLETRWPTGLVLVDAY